MELYRGFDIISLPEEDALGNYWTVCKDGKELARLPCFDDCYDWIDATIQEYKRMVRGEITDLRHLH